MFRILVHSIGTQGVHYQMVWSDNGPLREAEFETRDDAEECCRVIRRLRTDSAFIGCEVCEPDQGDGVA